MHTCSTKYAHGYYYGIGRDVRKHTDSDPSRASRLDDFEGLIQNDAASVEAESGLMQCGLPKFKAPATYSMIQLFCFGSCARIRSPEVQGGVNIRLLPLELHLQSNQHT